MKNLRHLSQTELETLIISIGEKPFRVKQINEWIWQKNITSIDEMLNV